MRKPQPPRETVETEPHVHGPGCDHDHHAAPAPHRRRAPKVGRNAPCPCGSGRKFKKCCGADG